MARRFRRLTRPRFPSRSSFRKPSTGCSARSLSSRATAARAGSRFGSSDPPRSLPEAAAAAGSAVLEIPMVAKELAEAADERVSLLVRAVLCGGGAAGIRLLLVVLNALRPGGASGQSRRASDRFGRAHHGRSGRAVRFDAGQAPGRARETFSRQDAREAFWASCRLRRCSRCSQSVERVLGSWSTSVAAVCLLWGAAGAIVAAALAALHSSRSGTIGRRVH